MPIYEFVCEDCFEEFEELVSFNATGAETSCPQCGSDLVRRKISTFASKISGGLRLDSSPSRSSCGTRST